MGKHLFDELKLLIQVVDFVVKACRWYLETPDGMKEYNDILDAQSAVERGNTPPLSSEKSASQNAGSPRIVRDK